MLNHARQCCPVSHDFMRSHASHAPRAQVYTGGIGSYALITMVCAFLQLHNSRRPAAKGKVCGKV